MDVRRLAAFEQDVQAAFALFFVTFSLGSAKKKFFDKQIELISQIEVMSPPPRCDSVSANPHFLKAGAISFIHAKFRLEILQILNLRRAQAFFLFSTLNFSIC